MNRDQKMSQFGKCVRFATPSGNEYYYDDVSGHITAQANPLAAPRAPTPHVPPPRATAEKIRSRLEQYGYRQLILETTQACNLRCRYCCYGEDYPATRQHGTVTMSQETAKRAIDFYMENFIKTCYTTPARNPMITFYGGEPLLNLPLVEKTVNYIKSEYPGFRPEFNLTTNGTLLTDETADFLVQDDFSIVVSLDGNKTNHDRNRVTADGQGTFDAITHNLARLKQRHPGYGKLGVNVCFDYDTNLEEAADFFQENDYFVVMANLVSEQESTYYNRFAPEDKTRFETRMDALRRRYYDTATKDGMLAGNNTFLMALFAFTFVEFACRPCGDEKRADFFPHTASCMPGEKIYVTTDGTIHMCERISPSFPIGTLDGGLDFRRIADLVNQLNAFHARCGDCRVSRLCAICPAQATAGERLEIPERVCRARAETVKAVLSSYVGLMESNPEYLDKSIMGYYGKVRERVGDIVD